MAFPVGALANLGLGLYFSYLGRRRSDLPIGTERQRRVQPRTVVRRPLRYVANFVYGQARTECPLFWTSDRAFATKVPNSIGEQQNATRREFHMALAVSEGPCESLQALYLDNVRVQWVGDPVIEADGAVRRRFVGGGSDRLGSGYVWSHFKADGTQGGSLRAATETALDSRRRWTVDHRCEFFSWLHVQLDQPPYGTFGDGERSRDYAQHWTGVPRVEAYVQGRKVRIPGSGHPDTWPVAWSESAAAVWFDWLRERRRLPVDHIDLPSVRRAEPYCAERLALIYDPTSTAANRCGEPFQQQGDQKVGVVSPQDLPPSPFTARAPSGFAQYSSSALCPPTGDLGPRIKVGDPPLNDIGLDPGIPDLTGPNSGPDIDIDPDDLPDLPDTDGRDYTGLGLNQTIRYHVGGVIAADDDVEAVEEELNEAWQGALVDWNGSAHFRPGRDEPIAAHLDNDIGKVTAIRFAPPLSERANALSIALAQSATPEDQFQAGAPIRLVDTEQVERDGREVHRDLGVAELQVYPIAVRRNLYTELRRARPQGAYEFECHPGLEAERFDLMPTDRVTVTDSFAGLDRAPCRIENVNTREDWSLAFDLTRAPNGIYADRLCLNDLPPDIGDPGNYAPVPEGVRLDELNLEDENGERIVLEVAFQPNAAAHGSIVQYRPKVPGGALHARYGRFTEKRAQTDVTLTATPGWDFYPHFRLDRGQNAVLIPGVRRGIEYEVRVLHLSRNGVPGDWSPVASRVIGGDLDAPAAPAPLTRINFAGGWRVDWPDAEEPDFKDCEVWLSAAGEDRETGERLGYTPSSFFHYRHEDLPAVPPAYDVHVARRDRSRNRSAFNRIRVQPGGDTRGQVFFDYAFFFTDSTTATVPKPSGNYPGGGWSRLPAVPGPGARFGFVSYRITIVEGKDREPIGAAYEFTDWTEPELWAVAEAVGNFNVRVALRFRRLTASRRADPLGWTADYRRPDSDYPLAQVQVQYWREPDGAQQAWELLAQRQVLIAKLTADGLIEGHIANLDESIGDAPEDKDKENPNDPEAPVPAGTRFAYRWGVASTSPAVDSAAAGIPGGWYATEIAAEASFSAATGSRLWRIAKQGNNPWGAPVLIARYYSRVFYAKTTGNASSAPVRGGVRGGSPLSQPPAPGGSWIEDAPGVILPRASAPGETVWQLARQGNAGAYTDVVIVDQTFSIPSTEPAPRSVYARNNSASHPPAIAGSAYPPAGWSTDADPPGNGGYIWRATQTATNNVYGNFGAPVLHAVDLERTWYVRTNSAQAPEVETSGGSSALLSPGSPGTGWIEDGEGFTFPTARSRYQWKVTRRGNAVSYTQTGPTLVRQHVPPPVLRPADPQDPTLAEELPGTTQHAYMTTSAATGPPSPPTSGPNSAGWSASRQTPTAARRFEWRAQRTAPARAEGTDPVYGAWIVDAAPLRRYQTVRLWCRHPITLRTAGPARPVGAGSGGAGSPTGNEGRTWQSGSLSASGSLDSWSSLKVRLWPAPWPNQWGAPVLEDEADIELNDPDIDIDPGG